MGCVERNPGPAGKNIDDESDTKHIDIPVDDTDDSDLESQSRGSEDDTDDPLKEEVSEDEDYTSIGAILRVNNTSFTELIQQILTEAIHRHAAKKTVVAIPQVQDC